MRTYRIAEGTLINALWWPKWEGNLKKRGGGCQTRLKQLSTYAYLWSSLVIQMVKNPPAMWETWVQSLGQEDSPEEGMATHSSILAWRIPWTEEPGGLWSVGSQRVRHNWSDLTHPQIICICITDSLYSTIETNTTLYSNFTPIKINFKKEKIIFHNDICNKW